MKIAIVVSVFPETSETFIVNQISNLIDRGHKVQIFAFLENKKAVKHQKLIDYNLLKKTTYYSESKVPRFKYFQLIKFSFRNFKNINFNKFYRKFNFFKYQKKSFSIDSFRDYNWILTHGKFDIIHAHFGPNGSYIANLKSLGFFYGSKFVTTFHGYDLNPKTISQFKIEYQKLFLEVDILTVNTAYTKSLLEDITTRNKVEILPVGLDTKIFKREKNSKNKKFEILFVGRLIELKAPNLAIEIMNLLVVRGHKNIKLTIVGEGEMKSGLEELIKTYELKNYVTLTGALSQEEIIILMQKSDVFLMPGIYDQNCRAETQGLVIQEAQAMELPVLVSDVGGMKFGLIDGETGFVIKENDLQAFVEKIELLFKNEDLKREMGEKGRNFVVENYDSKLLGMQLEQLYCNLLKI